MSVLLLLFPHAASASGAPSGAPPPVIEMANGLAADQAGGPVLSLPQYVSELDRWTHAIENAPEDAAALKALRKTVPPEWNVNVDGSPVRVPANWLTRALYDIEANGDHRNARIKEIQAHLATLRESAASLTLAPPGPAAADDARKKLNAILSRKEFAGAQGPSPIDRLIDKVKRWLDRMLSKIFRKVHISGHATDYFAWAAIVVAFLALSWWTVRYLRERSRQQTLDLRGAAKPPAGSREWAREAVAAAQRGGYRDAIHCAYWAGIARLEESGALPPDRARTPRESLRVLDAKLTQREPLANLTQRLEWTWYGDHAATAADWDEVVSQLERIGGLLRSTHAIAAS
ncbi:MAG: DUF4129 domain-containing protein [Candidatus Acidiferrales bacterium]